MPSHSPDTTRLVGKGRRCRGGVWVGGWWGSTRSSAPSVGRGPPHTPGRRKRSTWRGDGHASFPLATGLPPRAHQQVHRRVEDHEQQQPCGHQHDAHLPHVVPGVQNGVLRISRVVEDRERPAKPVVRWLLPTGGWYRTTCSRAVTNSTTGYGRVTSAQVRVMLADVGDLDDDPAGLGSRVEASTVQQRLPHRCGHHRADQDQQDEDDSGDRPRSFILTSTPAMQCDRLTASARNATSTASRAAHRPSRGARAPRSTGAPSP